MFEMKMNVVLMYSKPYQFVDDKTGELREGLTVEYYPYGEDGSGLAPKADPSGSMGIRRSKASMNLEMKEKLVFVPGIYSGLFEMAVDANGKPTLKLLDIDFAGKCRIVPMEEEAVPTEQTEEQPAELPAEPTAEQPTEEKNEKAKDNKKK